ncbi:MAG: PspC domain-containing protein [Clostridium sp.]|nr:PspC domain-containing protein [Clostridium sp.]
MPAKKLYRSNAYKMIGGVCGGLAEYFDIDPTIIRLAWVFLTLWAGFGVLAYIIAWIVIPLNPNCYR